MYSYPNTCLGGSFSQGGSARYGVCGQDSVPNATQQGGKAAQPAELKEEGLNAPNPASAVKKASQEVKSSAADSAQEANQQATPLMTPPLTLLAAQLKFSGVHTRCNRLEITGRRPTCRQTLFWQPAHERPAQIYSCRGHACRVFWSPHPNANPNRQLG